MMKIALELQPCCGQPSGVGLYTYELARRLQNSESISFQGNIFNFLGRNDNAQSLRDITIPIVENKCMPYGVYRRIWNQLPLAYESFFPCADVSHFFNYIVPPHIQGKVITTLHDVTYLRFPETMDQRNLKRISNDIAYSVERSEKIITVSEFSKQELISLVGIPDEKISIISPAASIDDRLAPEEILRQKFAITGAYLLYVGNLEPRKNLGVLIKAFEQLKVEMGIPHQLVIAGGKGWNAEDMLATIQNSPYCQDIVLTGYVSAAEKNRLYKNADVFVFPSIYEGFGMPPLEAMRWDTPVVCSNAASIPEVVGDGALLFPPNDHIRLAEAIYTMVTDETTREMVIKNGQLRTECFTWDKSVARLSLIYQQMR